MAFEQFVQHATEAEPVGAGIVSCAFWQDFRRHVAVSSSAIWIKRWTEWINKHANKESNIEKTPSATHRRQKKKNEIRRLYKEKKDNTQTFQREVNANRNSIA